MYVHTYILWTALTAHCSLLCCLVLGGGGGEKEKRMIGPRVDHEAKQKRKHDPMRGIHGGKRQLTGGNISLDQFQTSWLVSCFRWSSLHRGPVPFFVFCFFCLKPTDDVPFRSQAGSQPGNPVSPAIDRNGQLLFVNGEVSSSSAGCIFDVSSDMYSTQDCSTHPRLPACLLPYDWLTTLSYCSPVCSMTLTTAAAARGTKIGWDGTG